MKEGLRLKGHYELVCRDVITGEVKIYSLDNQLTSLYQNDVLKQLKGESFDSLDIRYIAVGTNSATATKNDTQLGAEIFRRQPQRQVIDSANSYLLTTMIILPSEAIATIREIGVFCGNATASANTGMLISRVNVNIEKTASMELSINRYDYVTI